MRRRRRRPLVAAAAAEQVLLPDVRFFCVILVTVGHSVVCSVVVEAVSPTAAALQLLLLALGLSLRRCCLRRCGPRRKLSKLRSLLLLSAELCKDGVVLNISPRLTGKILPDDVTHMHGEFSCCLDFERRLHALMAFEFDSSMGSGLFTFENS